MLRYALAQQPARRGRRVHTGDRESSIAGPLLCCSALPRTRTRYPGAQAPHPSRLVFAVTSKRSQLQGSLAAKIPPTRPGRSSGASFRPLYVFRPSENEEKLRGGDRSSRPTNEHANRTPRRPSTFLAGRRVEKETRASETARFKNACPRSRRRGATKG